MEKIKVLLIIHNISSGGVEKTRYSIAKYLKNSCDLKILCTEARGEIANKLKDFNIDIIQIGRFDSIFNILQHLKIQKIISLYKPHIIHGAVFEGVTMAAINGFIKRVPVIIIEETSDPQNRSWRANLLMKLFSLVSDSVIAIAPNVADYLTKVAKISEKKVKVINNGVEMPRNVSESEIENLKIKYGIKPDEIIIGSVGRLLNDHKKFTDILETLKILSDSRIKLLIVGTGIDEHLIKNKAVELNIEKQLIMVGYQFDTAPFFKLMDIFCLASQREGFGLVAAEAMLHKLPVIATRVGGLQNVVDDYETGYLVPPNNPQQIAEKAIKLINQPNLRKQMGEAGYYKASNFYTEKRYANDVNNLYIDLLKRKGIIS